MLLAITGIVVVTNFITKRLCSGKVQCAIHIFFPSNLQNPDIVLVHYLNVPYPDDNKMAVITPSLALWGDKKEWTKEELVSQLKPMCTSKFSIN